MKKKRGVIALSEISKLMDRPEYLEAVRALRALNFDYEGMLGFAAAMLCEYATTEGEVRRWLANLDKNRSLGSEARKKAGAEKYELLDRLIFEHLKAKPRATNREIFLAVMLKRRQDANTSRGLVDSQIERRIKDKAPEFRHQMRDQRKT